MTAQRVAIYSNINRLQDFKVNFVSRSLQNREAVIFIASPCNYLW